MEDLDPDLFPEGDGFAGKKKSRRPRQFTPEEAYQRAKESRARYAKRTYAANLKKGLTAHGKPRQRELSHDLYTRIVNRGEKEKRVPRSAKVITEEHYRALRNKDNHQLSRKDVTPISDAEAHDLIAVNQIVTQEGGFLLRYHYMNVGEGGWMKKKGYG